ncbi:MAG: hypothetical protein JWR83_2553 [Aeromicrobium sp.]|nr:hypothetical protein [Aeromicrobium sp.]
MTTLTDDRIESMRSTVMHAVDTDIARRGTRVRRTIGLAAASVLVVGFGSYGLGQLGSGNVSEHAGTTTRADSGASKSSAGDTQLDSVPESASGKLDSSKPIPPISKEPADRQVIVTGTVNLRVKDPKDVAQKLSTYVDTIGGRVDERTQNNDPSGGSAFLKVRVPSGKVTGTIDHLKAYGTVEDVSLQNNDVTSQTTDLAARIRALRLSISRLETIMGNANTSTQLIKAESALTKRQAELDSLQAQRTELSGQVQLSTLSIDLSQKTKADKVSPGGFHGGLVDGWNALVSTVNHIVKVIGVLLPWAAIVAAVYGAYALVTRRRRSN